MAKDKTLGFFNFHITADKAFDFLRKNGFEPEDLSITTVKAGEQFGDDIVANQKLTTDEAFKEPDHRTIINFFKHLFHFEGKQIDPALPYVADRNGFILTVQSTGDEQKQVARESLDDHGAYFIKEL